MKKPNAVLVVVIPKVSFVRTYVDLGDAKNVGRKKKQKPNEIVVSTVLSGNGCF